ncbi:hypothetical protein CDAR_394371 [Caerostris darwini]|uniref:Uncharacterized protein n=1 Tax=Caerostris darwini TaxID=1538125 RepID=A0AAV4RK22_9ARAC|nr:hypothetical protein CDAR_394371 [Caerostris darwini]
MQLFAPAPPVPAIEIILQAPKTTETGAEKEICQHDPVAAAVVAPGDAFWRTRSINTRPGCQRHIPWNTAENPTPPLCPLHPHSVFFFPLPLLFLHIQSASWKMVQVHEFHSCK